MFHTYTDITRVYLHLNAPGISKVYKHITLQERHPTVLDFIKMFTIRLA